MRGWVQDDLLIAALRTAAERGLPCPTNAALAVVARCSENSVSAAMARMARAGGFRIEKMARSQRRIVFADGAATGWTVVPPPPRRAAVSSMPAPAARIARHAAVTARLLGDPPIGRSALDQMRAEVLT